MLIILSILSSCFLLLFQLKKSQLKSLILDLVKTTQGYFQHTNTGF